MTPAKLRVGITHGDINGISYELLLKLFETHQMAQDLFTPVIYGSTKVAGFYRKEMNLPEFRWNKIEDASDADPSRVNIINVVAEDITVTPGVPSPEAGKAALDALERATADLRDGKIDLLVTCPINKSAIHSDEFSFPGHTEYLESRLSDPDNPSKAMMIMCGRGIRVALLTIHDPLSEVAAKMTREALVDAIGRFAATLVKDFGVHGPRIAVLGINPHAGDAGVIGKEEDDIIRPAIDEANSRHLVAFGPYPADGFWASGAYKKFDGILAIYHDQGLIPFKILVGEEGVNFTSGLPFIRTSPDHGTAFDIVGRGIADPTSLREAIYTAIDIHHARCREEECTRSPLRKQTVDRRKKRPSDNNTESSAETADASDTVSE
ncbi:MAG: 4-hydroxythreonine-4-phosphate dehydrogenase PdxA [Duncaniella sp.]|nr:4-hydroxythreonine-4-phosphate dehydrogenase PdxA [Duncaniella sp.]